MAQQAVSGSVSRFPTLREARAELDKPTISVYATAVLLDQGEAVVRRAIKSGELQAVALGRNIRVPSATVRRMLGLEG